MSTGKKYAVKDVVEGMEYEFRICAINISGAGEFSTPSDFVFARDPKSKLTESYIHFQKPHQISNGITGPMCDKTDKSNVNAFITDM